MEEPLFEHELRTFNWTEAHLIAFDRIRQKIGADVLRAGVRGTQKIVQAAQYVGVIRAGSETIEILPKIYSSRTSSKDRRLEATRNLLYLLNFAANIKLREHELAPLLARRMDWFEILTRIFAQHLSEEWQRGAHRAYQVVEGEQTALKGKWLVQDQLRHPERKHIFSVAYDEFSADNRLSRIFRFVVERLWNLSCDTENRRLLLALRQWMREVTLVTKLTASDAPPTLITRLNERFEPLLNLARLFLEGGALQVTSDTLNTYAFIFDMNQLFEAFITGFISKYREDILPEGMKQLDVLLQTTGHTRHLARTGKSDVFRLKPDLAFMDRKHFPLLIDAKYKRLNAADITLGVSQDDFYQMFSYSHRYECPRVVLLYPQTADQPETLTRCFHVKGTDRSIVVATVDLRADLRNPEYRDQLTKRLSNIITCEVA